MNKQANKMNWTANFILSSTFQEQNEQEQLSPSQAFIRLLKWEKFVSSLKCCGSEFQSFGALERKDLLPYVVVLTCGIFAVFVYLKRYELFLIVTRSCKYTGPCLLIILCTSRTIVLILRSFSVGNLDFFRRVS